MAIPTSLVISYILFSICLFYQKQHIKNFQGSSEKAKLAINIFALIATIFGLGFLCYYGYKVNWVHSIILFFVAFAMQFVWFAVEAKLRLQKFSWVISMAGFVIIPICGYFMCLSLP